MSVALSPLCSVLIYIYHTTCSLMFLLLTNIPTYIPTHRSESQGGGPGSPTPGSKRPSAATTAGEEDEEEDDDDDERSSSSSGPKPRRKKAKTEAASAGAAGGKEKSKGR